MTAVQSRYLSFVEHTAMLLLLAYPTLMLVVRGGMNGVFLCMLLLALAIALVRPTGMAATKWRREWTVYATAMLALSASMFISQAYHWDFSAHPYDAASRYWLGVPIFLMLLRLRPRVFSVLQIAFPVSAIVGFLMTKEMWGRVGIDTLDLIHFGDFELILGVLSIFSLDWPKSDRVPVRVLKVAGFIAGCAASFASGSRGGWLAIPVFIAIFIYFRRSRPSRRVVVATISASLMSVALLYSLNSVFQQRVNELANELATFDQGNRDTSTGIRWQLYKAAAEVFVEHPVVGVGPEGFAREMRPMMEAGKVTPVAAEYGRGEVHSDVLAKAAGMGVLGLLAMLAIYVVPFRLFWKATHSQSMEVRRAAILGVTFVSGFFVFGLTVEVLNLTMATAFYSFTVAVLLAACYNIHHGEPAPGDPA